jgi:hypothetical protein
MFHHDVLMNGANSHAPTEVTVSAKNDGPL